MSMSGDWADDEPTQATDREFVDIDAQGNKVITTIIEKNGRQYKQKRTLKKRTRTRIVNKRAEERKKNWVAFGKAVENDSGVTVLQEEIKFDIRGMTDANHHKNQDIERQMTTILTNLEGGGRWIRKSERQGFLPGGERADNEPTTPLDEKPGRGGQGVYVAPGARGGPKERDRFGDENYTLRVTNLSESVTEDNLKALFSRFGSLQRVFLVKDKTTKVSKGFAFVSYVNRTDAEKAMAKVHGMGHDHLILQVEWARPQAK